MVNQRDRGLLLALTLLSAGSMGTTLLGAKQILPSPLAEVVGVSVQAMLFAMLAGFMLDHAPVRKWLAVGVFSVISVYTSFFTYHDELTGTAETGAQLEVALQAHAIVTGTLYTPLRTDCQVLRGEAEALYEAAKREAGGGSVTGVKGYGPVARKYGREASAKAVDAERACSLANRLQPLFEIDVEGLTPEDIFKADLTAWQQAGSKEMPAPSRADYVDLNAQVALLTPIHRIAEGQVPAIMALLLALLVDGMGLLLGTAVVIPVRRG